MKKERKKRVVAAILTLALSLALLIPYSCQDKQDSSPQLVAQENTSEFFVNEDMAKTVAQNFMRKTNPSLKSTKNYKLEKIKDEMGEELIYVINFDEGGFVLMPADNRVEPILAFSENNYFETKNVEQKNGVGLWVSNTKEGIKKIKKSKDPQSEVMKELWEKHLFILNLKDEGDPPDDPCVPSSTTVGPLISTTWRQGDGFNADCPLEAAVEAKWSCSADFSGSYLNGRAYAGCVAVAMGQIMNYHEHPTSYSWNSMPSGRTGNSAAADLLFDIGTEVGMEYKCNGSFAATSNIVPALENDFNYSTSATKASYSYSDFMDVRAEINTSRPVILTGTSAAGGHAWVCDGYRTNIHCINGLGYVYNYLHMNWGWGGDSDGYFYYNNFNGFTSDKYIIKGIKP